MWKKINPRVSKDERLQKTINNFIRFPIYFFGFILFSLAFAYFTFKLMSFSRTVDVPDLTGKNLIEANELLAKRGLILKIEGEDYDSSVASGYIIRQDVPVGSKIKEHRGIKVVLSKGAKVQSVPYVVGESMEKAEYILLQNGLKIGRIIHVHSSTVERDKVIAQKPGSNEHITEKITLIVSSGPYETVYYCPEFRGKNQADAQQLADKLGLKLKITGYGEVVKIQKPKGGSLIKSGETIELQLEQGGVNG
ncbi:MAG: PASTA domain-containing protein [Nitrospirae bacterium]|nr:PASTA domain-containing protein [Nitrospirota bacterium]